MADELQLGEAFELTERRLETALRSVGRLASGLKAGHKAARVGDLAALHKALGDLDGQLQLVRTEAVGAAQSWAFTEEAEIAYFADGRFTDELLVVAQASGLRMSVEDGTVVCYPSLVKVDAAKRLVLVDRKPYRNVRPSSLVAHLKAVQSRPPQFKPAQFLESLYVAWDHARHLHAAGQQPSKEVRVDHLYTALTIAPGSAKEYSKPEFGRDLYLLQQSPERLTRKGARLSFSAATTTKGGAGTITVVAEDGRKVLYSIIIFEA